MISHLQEKWDELDANQILHYAALAIALAMVALTGQLLLSTFSVLGEELPQASVTSSKQQAKAEYNARIITQSNLFGVYRGDNSISNNLPETRLQLELRGAFTSSNPDQASAIIKGPDGESRAYKVNSRVYGTAQLHKVFADRVVLSRNGQLETLYFPDPGTHAGSRRVATGNDSDSYTIPNDAAKLIQDNMSLSEIQQASKELSSSAMTPEQRQALIRKRLQDLRNRVNRKNN